MFERFRAWLEFRLTMAELRRQYRLAAMRRDVLRARRWAIEAEKELKKEQANANDAR